jgi:Protein of unknown function (DUF3172)
MKRKPPKPPSRSRYSDDNYSNDGYSDDDYGDRSDRYTDRSPQPEPKAGGILNWKTGAILGAIFTAGLALGIFFSSATTSDIGSVATRYDIDRSAPNPEICVQYGASAIAVDLRAFVTLSPFAVHVSQPKMQPGCVVRSSNWSILQSRSLVTSQEVNECRNRMNTFGFTGDIEKRDAASHQIDCLYQNDSARNLFLPQTGNDSTAPEVNRF